MTYYNILDTIISYFGGYQTSVKDEAIELELTGAYFVYMAATIFASASLCNLAYHNYFDLSIIKSIYLWHLTLIYLPSYYDNVAILNTAKLFPHLIIGCMIGMVLNDMVIIFIDINANMPSICDFFTCGTQVFQLIFSSFVLKNQIIINIYLFYICTEEFTRLCRFTIRYIYETYFEKYSKNALHYGYLLTILFEYYAAFGMFWRFRSILPINDLFLLGSVHTWIHILTNIHLWEEVEGNEL